MTDFPNENSIPDSRARAEMAGSFTYSQVKEKATAFLRLYAQNNIELPPTCGLSLLIADTTQIADLWATGRAREITAGQLFNAVQLNRIADSLSSLNDVHYRSKYLRDLTSAASVPSTEPDLWLKTYFGRWSSPPC